MDISELRVILDFIPQARQVVRKFLDSHQNEIEHGQYRLNEELPLLNHATNIISRKWAIHVLWLLESKTSLYFNEIIRFLPNISTRSLSNTLKDLEDQKIIERKISEDRPPKVFYSLTSKGKGFVELALLVVFYLNSDNPDFAAVSKNL